MTIALVSSAVAAGLNGATTGAIDTTGASLLVCEVGNSDGSGTVTDSKGNTWTPGTSYGAVGSPYTRFYYAWNPTVGTGHTFTITATGTAPAISASSWSGVQTSSDPLDTQAGGNTGASTVTSAGVGSSNVTPSVSNCLIITGDSFGAANSSFAGVNGNTAINHTTFVSGTNYGVGVTYRIQTTAATISSATALANWTTAVKTTYNTIVFKSVSPVLSGVASITSSTSTTINASVGAASGGTAPYTYAWVRLANNNDAYASGTSVGTNSVTLADSSGLLADTPYFYQCRAVDSAGSPATVYSNVVGSCLKSTTAIIGFIGDSITAGYGLSAGQYPPEQVALLLNKLPNVRTCTISNRGVNATKTSDWTTDSAGTNLYLAKAAFVTAGVTHVHIMLGANDAAVANLVSAATYLTNLTTITSNLVAAGYKVILSYPTYIIAGANSGATTAASVDLTYAYHAQIDTLINNSTIFRGDTVAWKWFMQNQSEYQADLTHPNATGAISLANMWANAIGKVLRLGAGSASITCTLVTVSNSPQASLTGLKWAWWDDVTPNLLSAPTDQGSIETTDGSGALTISLPNSVKTSGQVGWLTVTNSDGTTSQSPAHKAFTGPVAVS